MNSEEAKMNTDHPKSPYGADFDANSLITSEQCLKAMDEIDAEKARIEGQISAAIARFHASGERGDPMWFSRAKSALQYKKRIRQRVQERLGILRRQERKVARSGPDQWAWEFYNAARKRLQPEIIRILEEEAKARIEELAA